MRHFADFLSVENFCKKLFVVPLVIGRFSAQNFRPKVSIIQLVGF